MAQTWTIFVSGQPTVERAVVHELEYHGSWMEEEYVSVNVRSATPITFQYGDHLYYRGTKFEINYDPNFIKKARSGSYGEGFTYDNIKLYPVSVKLKDIAFKDVVLNDPSAPANTLVYSSLGTFAFFAGSVEDLADRIMANLNRDYNGEWRVYTPYKARSIQRNGNIGAWGQYYNGDGSTIQGKTDINIECQNLSVMDALKMAYTSFDLSFYVTGKVIVIGGKPISADYDFEYGKGNGLYEIERTHDDSQRIVTKLYAYGSDKNLPLNYYANIGKRIKITIVHKDKREITMGNPQLILWVNKEWTKSLADAFSPTFEVKLTYGNLSARFGVSHDTYTYAEEQDDSTLDHTTDYMFFWSLSDKADALAMYNAIASGAAVYVTGVNINEMPADFIETPTSYNYDAALSITKLMLPGFPTMSLYSWVASHGASNLNPMTGRATWRGYTAYFSMNAADPWIKSENAGNIGVREGTVEFDSSSDKEIFPTIEGTGFDEVAWCEQIEDNGHIDKELTFALQPMTVDGSDGDIEWDYGGVSISMKDGYCTGREFEVAEAKLNDNGDWELTMKRKKDDSLGVYFPYKSGSGNLYQIMGRGNHHGQLDGDHFVILGIPLPQSYVENAAAMLLEEALKHLAKVDHQSYTYLPRIDEIEMARQHDLAMASQGTITSIHDTICAGMQMQIDDDDLNVHYSPFIDNITIKENGNNGIPTYDVVLKDEKEMTMQERIQSQIDGGKDAIINSISPEGEWLSKVSDDTAQGMITFLRGLQVGERFVTGLLGEGGVFRVEDDGTTYIEADKLYIRMKAYFDSVEIREYHHTGGNRIASVAGARCCRVEWIDSQGNVLEKTQANLSSVVKFRCYFMGNDGEDEVRNNWVVGDLAYCHITTVETEDDSPTAKGLNMRHYWRKVVGRNATGTLTVKGEHWIDLSNVSGEYQSGSDVPVAQDDIIQLGNVNDTDRQGAIIEFVTGADAPSYQIFQGINSFSLTGKNYVRFGYDSQNHSAQAYIGNPDGSTYLWYHYVTEGGQTFPRLDIKANVQFTSPITHQDTTIEDFAGAVTQSIEDLQEQIDGEIDTWYYSGVPTLNNAPANDWTTDELKNDHLGDLYYDKDTGLAYRFVLDGSTYKWVQIHDDAVAEALRIANEAQDTADSKRRVFLTTPTPPYDNGDLWVNAVWPASGAEQGTTYNNDILRCQTSKTASQQFAIADWTLASKYTDNSALTDFVTNTYASDLADIQTQVDGKAETHYQDTDPSTAWFNTEDKEKHVGDIWCDTSANGGKKTYIWRDRGEGQQNRFYWAEQAVPDVVFDEVDKKAAIYVTWNGWMTGSTNNLNEKDLFIPAADTTQGGVTYKKDKVYRCIDASIPSFEEIHYTDDSQLDAFIARYVQDLTGINTNITNAQTTANSALSAAGTAQTTADNAAAIAAASDYLRQALTQATDIVGGLVLTTTIGLRDSNNNVWSGISGAYQASETGTGYKGHGIAAWYGGGMVDHEVTPSASNYAKSLFRFDGSGYVSSGNISWDKDGVLTIKGNSITAATELKVAGSDVLTQTTADARYVTIDWFRSLFRAYNSSDTELTPNGSTSGLDSIKAMVGFWTESYISALGQNSGGGGGGGITLNEPLLSINQAGLSAPTTNGSVLVYNNGWKYSSSANIFATGITVAGTATAAGFSATGKDNTYVLLAGGGTKLLSEIGGGGSVSGIKLGNSSTTYGPDQDGVITLPAYPSNYITGISFNGVSPIQPSNGIVGLGGLTTVVKVGSTSYNVSASGVVELPAYPSTSGLVSGISFNGGNPIAPTSGVVSLGGLTTSVKVGSTSYNVSSAGVVVLPAYPTVPTKVSQLTNDSGYITSYTDTKNTAGATNLAATKLFLIGATAQNTNPVSYSNVNCYVGTDNCLYSGGSKVLTGITKAMVTDALGYTPPTSDTNTWRTVQCNGTSIGNNTLNLKAGTNVSISASNGTLTFSSTDTNTDTKNTAGGTNLTATKLFIVGLSSQSDGLRTYSNSNCYIGTDNCLYSGGSKVLTSHQSLSGYLALSGGTMTGKITMTQSATTRDVGIIGTYDYTKAAAIWCMGSSYQIASNGTGLGSLYGAAYVYQSQAGQGVMAGGHQFVWAQNGSANVALGTNVWTSGKFIKNGGTSSQFLKADGSVDSNAYITGITKAMVTTALGYTPPTSDTNTWRTVQCNGTSIGNNTLNLKAGTNVSISASNGTLTFSATDTNTDTKNTAGGTNLTGTKLFIVGLTSQSDGLRTYSNSNCYIGTDNCLYSGGTKVLTSHQSLSGYATQSWVTSQGYIKTYTDTKNTVGATNLTSNQLYLVGATAQNTYTTSYTLSTCYISSSGYICCTRDSGRAFSWGANNDIYVGSDKNENAYLWVTPSLPLRFGVNNSEKMRITTSGTVGIGTTTPGSSFKLYVNGSSGGASAWANTSDVRKKNIINNVNLELWQIAQAPLFRFRWKDTSIDTNIHIGTSAQYWQTVAPETVMDDGAGNLGLEYSVVALLSAITTAKKVQDHENRIQALERENAYLKNELKRLTA